MTACREEETRELVYGKPARSLSRPAECDKALGFLGFTRSGDARHSIARLGYVRL